MRCGTLLGPILSPYKTPTGEVYGSAVAEQALIGTTLTIDPDLSWDFWHCDFKISPTAGRPVKQYMPDRAALQRQFGSRCRLRDFRNLSKAAEGSDYLFLTSLPTVPSVDEMRQQLGCHRMPVCGLLHAALTGDMLPDYILLALSLEYGDTLVATSRAGKTAVRNILHAAHERISRYYPDEARPQKAPEIAEIPLGVNIPDESVLQREPARALLRLPADAFVVLYLGRISESYKADLDPLLAAVAPLMTRRGNVRLILAGQCTDPQFAGRINSRFAALGIGEHTLFLQNFPDFLKSTLYAASDVFVLPADSVQETFGLAILEAMAHERPVIAPSWSGYRDLVENEATGFLLRTTWSCEAGGKASSFASMIGPLAVSHYLAQRSFIDVAELSRRLEQLADDPAMARAMGERGRRRAAEQFSWHSSARSFLELWSHQIEVARHAPRTARPFVALNDFFRHYADRVFSPRDVLVRVTPGIAPEALSSHWQIPDVAEFDQICAILEACDKAPVAAQELIRKGVSSDCIMWVLKKGLCRVSSSDAESD